MDVDNFFYYFKIVLIGIMIAAFIVLVVSFFDCVSSNGKYKSQIVQLKKTIEQQDILIEAVQEDTDMKINQIMVSRNKAIKERDQYEKKFKKALSSKRVIKICDDSISLRLEQGATVYDCQPII